VEGTDEVEMRSMIFAEWSAPVTYSNELAILEVQLSVTSYVLLAGVTLEAEELKDVTGTSSITLTGIDAATLRPMKLRARNALGWGPWSETAWMWTNPSEPDAPDEVACPANLQVEPKDKTLQVRVGMAQKGENGQDVIDVQLRVYLPNGTVFREYHKPPNGTITLFDVDGDGDGVFLTPSTQYTMQARAFNKIGNGSWSTQVACSTEETPVEPDEPFPYWVLAIVLVCIILCLLGCGFWAWKVNLPKVLAPKLRRRRSKDVKLEDYMSSEFEPMEEEDPDLTVNPVLAAKIAMQKERERKAKRRAGGLTGGGGRAGGLKKLNINFGGANAAEQERKNKLNKRQQIDDFLGVEEGPSRVDPDRKAEGQKKLKKRLDALKSKETEQGSMATINTARAAAKQPVFSSEFSEKL